MTEMRLQKFLARAGVASRRHAEELIAAGRVTVNGARVTEMGVKVNPAADAVAVDGAPVALPKENATFLLHKPAGYVTTMSDPQGRPTVAELMADELLAHPGLFPVGRLDTDTTGFLLFTDDGQLGHGLLHPRRHVEKTYLALVEGVPDAGDVRRLREGVLLDDGLTLPAGVRVLEGADGRRAAQLIGEGTGVGISCANRLWTTNCRFEGWKTALSATAASAAATRLPPGDPTWKCACARAATAKCAACWTPWGIR